MKELERWSKNLINLIYKVNDVQQNYFYYQAVLTDIVIDILQYENLEMESLTDEEAGEEIEYRRITQGHCGIIDHPKFGLIPCNSRLWDYDLFGNFSKATFYNPYKNFITGYNPTVKEINKDCVVIYDGSLQKKLYAPIQTKNIMMQKINRTARKLADIDATLNMYCINTRQPYIITTRNQQTHASLLEVFKKLKRGEFFIGLDKDIIKEATSLKNADITTGFITELIDARNTEIKLFLQDMGIYSTDDKKERLIVDEVEQENKNVKIFLYSYLKSAEIGIEHYNKLYNKNASVKLRKILFDDSNLYSDIDDYEIKEEYKGDVINED